MTIRHDHIEVQRKRPPPFTERGSLSFILKAFDLPDDMTMQQAEDAFRDSPVRVHTVTGKSCWITRWSCTTGNDGPVYEVEAVPVLLAPPPTFTSKPLHAAIKTDPWIKVGTTTIDGDLKAIAAMFGTDDINKVIKHKDVRRVGGRDLQPTWWETNRGTGLVFCDIVRRQYEIDAEARLHPCVNCETPTDMMFCADCTKAAKAAEPPCPECGPHGNRGRVALAFSEVACTTCAGGVPGDAFGRVADNNVVDLGVEEWLNS